MIMIVQLLLRGGGSTQFKVLLFSRTLSLMHESAPEVAFKVYRIQGLY